MRQAVNRELNSIWKPCSREDELHNQGFCSSRRTIWFDHQVFDGHPVLSTEALSGLHHGTPGSAIGERRIRDWQRAVLIFMMAGWLRVATPRGTGSSMNERETLG
jgi:hypothetical protein